MQEDLAAAERKAGGIGTRTKNDKTTFYSFKGLYTYYKEIYKIIEQQYTPTFSNTKSLKEIVSSLEDQKELL
jgi:hypothetical protein